MHEDSINTISALIFVFLLIFLFIVNRTRNKITIGEKELLTEEESAEYLNISIDEFKNILLMDSAEKVGLTSYSTLAFIHYIEVGHEKKMFNKKELDEWLKYNG